MDLKRFDEIDGLDVLKRLSREESIYNTHGNELYIDDCKMWMSNGELTGVVNITIADILSGKWFIKKPFDVRTEMLARPNEWVGAFKDNLNRWHKIGLDSRQMVAIESRYEVIKPNWNDDRCEMAALSEIDRCISIEDVPKEELT